MTLDELNKIKERGLEKIHLRLDKNPSCKIYVATGYSGLAQGSRQVLSAMLDEAANLGLNNLLITQGAPTVFEGYEPVVEVYDINDNKVIYGKVNPEIAKKILSYAIAGKILEEYVIDDKKVNQ